MGVILSMLWVYGQYDLFHLFSAGIVIRRQNLTSNYDPVLKWLTLDLVGSTVYCLVHSNVTFFISTLYHLLNMLKIKCDINRQYLKTVDLNFVKTE